MRLWYISPAYLDNQRLLAAHQENHALLSCVRNKSRWGSFPIIHKPDMTFPKRVHDLTVTEMFIRKNLELYRTVSTEDLFNNKPPELIQFLELHESAKKPYSVSDLPPECFIETFQPSRELLVKDYTDLVTKWTLEGVYFGIGRISISSLASYLEIKDPPIDVDLLRTHRETRDIVNNQFKTWFREYRSKHPRSRMQDRLQAFKLHQSLQERS